MISDSNFRIKLVINYLKDLSESQIDDMFISIFDCNKEAIIAYGNVANNQLVLEQIKDIISYRSGLNKTNEF